ncbi:hypothetical protein NVP1031O_139 [Vibrio phage 1.031.O._10N.261.46.F8]|nr:hypothetical protein NVP1031O_139 [Vibrio phage 1.031.O._10N.261.46.F8]
MLGGAGVWGVTFPTSTPLVGGCEDIDFEGDWTNNGFDAPDTVRELVMRNVSIKNVMDGFRENDLFKSKLDNVTITCRGAGYYSTGGGDNDGLVWCISSR